MLRHPVRHVFAVGYALTCGVCLLVACKAPLVSGIDTAWPTWTPSPSQPAPFITLIAISSLYPTPAIARASPPAGRGNVLIYGSGFTPGEPLVYTVRLTSGVPVPPTHQQVEASRPAGTFQVQFNLMASHDADCEAVFQRADGTEHVTNRFRC